MDKSSPPARTLPRALIALRQSAICLNSAAKSAARTFANTNPTRAHEAWRAEAAIRYVAKPAGAK